VLGFVRNLPEKTGSRFRFRVFATLDGFLEVFGSDSCSGEEERNVHLDESFKEALSTPIAAADHRRPPPDRRPDCRPPPQVVVADRNSVPPSSLSL
jgi:hypothetical protein